MIDTKRVIRSIEKIKNNLITTKEERNDLENNIKHLKNNALEMKSMLISQKSSSKDEVMTSLLVGVHLSTLETINDLMDVSELLDKSIKNL